VCLLEDHAKADPASPYPSTTDQNGVGTEALLSTFIEIH
jgi:hypothetical protein